MAVDLNTGKLKWYFQFIHHEIWDYDMSSAPLLMDITVDGKPIKAVAEPSKMGMLYVFDRITGKPVWPIPEKKVREGQRARRMVFADPAHSRPSRKPIPAPERRSTS